MLRSVRLSLWVTLLAVTTFRAASPLTVTVVRGHSMEPTLRPGTVSVFDRSYYFFHPLRRGDIVVLRLRDGTVIKRVYALPGEQLTLAVAHPPYPPARSAPLGRINPPNVP